MDELRKLRELAGPPLGDEDTVRQAARARLTETMGGAEVRRRIRRSWLPRLAVGGVATVAAGVMAVSFINADKTPAGLPGDGLYEAVGQVVQMDGWSRPRLCVSSLRVCSVELDGWAWTATNAGNLKSDSWSGRASGDLRLIGRFIGSRFRISSVSPVAAGMVPEAGSAAPEFTCQPSPRPRGALSQSDLDTAYDAIDLLSSERPSPVAMFFDSDRPERIVMNVRVRNGASDAIRRIRTLYRGPLCVVEGDVLDQEAIESMQRWLSANPDPVLIGQNGEVVRDMEFSRGLYSALIWRTVDDGGVLQRQLNERFGAGRVRVQPLFQMALQERQAVDRFWETFGRSPAFAERTQPLYTLAETRQKSALIIRGRIVGFRRTPVVAGTDRFAASVVIRPSNVLKGSVVGDTVVVRMFLSKARTRADAIRQLGDLSRTIPAHDVVAFLGPMKGGVYPLLNNDVGVWTRTGRALLATPLASSFPEAGGRHMPDIVGVQTLDQLVDAINYVGQFKTIQVPK